AMLSVRTIPSDMSVIGNVIVIERGRIVIIARRLIGYKTDNRSILDENRVRLCRLVRIIGKVKLRRSDDVLVHLPVFRVRTRCILSFLEHPDFISSIVTVITENVYIGQAGRAVVVILIGSVELSKFHMGADLSFSVARIRKV